MKTRFRLIRRGCRGGAFYCVDGHTGKRTSLKTSNEEEAIQIIQSKNQAEKQPALNLQIAKAYLAGTDSGITTRTWKNAIEALTATKQGANQARWLIAAKDRAFRQLLPQVIVETKAELLLSVLLSGTVSTNVYLRRLHNFCVDMNWLPWPIVPKKQWPAVKFEDKRAITWEEHCLVIGREQNPERRAFYKMAWHLGASQSDLAHLHAEDIDWKASVISFFRMKTRWRGGQPPQIRFGREAADVRGHLSRLPQPPAHRAGDLAQLPSFPFFFPRRPGLRPWLPLIVRLVAASVSALPCSSPCARRSPQPQRR